MRVQKPNTDQSCEVFISNGDKQYAEYIIDPEQNTRTPQPNVFESFIPVYDGEMLTVNIKFRGTVLHGAADIIADGAFVYDRRIEGEKNGRVKFQKRDWKIKEVYNVLEDPDYDAIQSGRTTVAGNLLVRSLDEGDVPLFVKGSGKLGLGSLAVIISVNQTTGEMYSHKYQHQSIGKWRDIRGIDHADGGIKPFHELEFKLEDDEVHFTRQQRHRRHLEQTRFGLKPWAVFVFYYRPQGAIQQGNCIARPDREMQLEPFLGDFTFADPEAIKKKRLATRAKNEREKAQTEDEEFYDGLEDSFAPEDDDQSEGLFVSRSPSRTAAEMPKKRLFGNSLSLQGAAGNAPRRDSRISERDAAAPTSHEQGQSDEYWGALFENVSTGDNTNVAQHHGQMQRGQHSNISADNQGDVFDFGFDPSTNDGQLPSEIDNFLQANDLGAPAAAPVANMIASSPTPGRPNPTHQPAPGDIVQSVEAVPPQKPPTQTQHLRKISASTNGEETNEPSPLMQMISSDVQGRVNEEKAAKNARIEASKAAKKPRSTPTPKGRPVFDPTAKTGYGYGNPKLGPLQGMAPTQQAMRQLDAQGQRMQGMLQDYLQSQTGSQQYVSPTQQPAQYRPWETSQPAKPAEPTQFPMSPPTKNVRPTAPSRSVAPSSSPAQASQLTPGSVVPRKRSASLASGESMQSKRARGEAQIADLRARIQERQKAKVAARKKLEEERQAREELERRRQEEDEAQAEEIRALQAELEGCDGEIEGIEAVGRQEAEEARMRELELEREE